MQSYISIMLYKSSILTAIFVLLSVGHAIASEIPTTQESAIERELATTSNVVSTTPKEGELTAKLDSLDIEPIDTTVNHDLPANKSNSLLANTELSNTDDRSNVKALNPESELTKKLALSHFSSLGYVFSDRAIAQISRTALQPNSSLAKTPDPSNVESFKLELEPAKDRVINKVSSLNDILAVPANDGAIAQAPEPTVQPNQPEPKKWAVGIHAQASTTGLIGADVGYKFSPNLHARLGLNTVGFNANYSSQGIDYTASLSPTNIHLLGDYFPFGGGLRFTGGLVIQNNQFTGTGKGSGGQVTLGTTTYNASDVGTIRSEGSFSSSVAPYVGIGLGTPIGSGLGFFMDAGVMFAGSPTVTLSRSGGITSPQIDQDLAAQQSRTNNDIKGFNIYPAISIGVSYAF